MSKVIIIGGGPAGMFAAIAAAENGQEVILLEQNEKLGKKLFITGKGRCNITNACDTQELFQNVIRNEKFLYSAFYEFDNFRVIDFFETHGLPTKIERGNRVFPVSDHSSDVIETLKKTLQEKKVKVKLKVRVKEVLQKEGWVTGVRMADGSILHADAVIVATGGYSYQATGSTGDGYRFAQSAGHSLASRHPSLVPFNIEEDYVKELQGLSLKNVKVSVSRDKKVIFEEFGEMLFTHFGVSGPLILSASSMVNDDIVKGNLHMTIDLKPALTQEQLDKRILRDFEESKNKQFRNVIGKLYPAKMIPVMIRLSGIDSEKKVNEITKEERMNLIACTKAFPMTQVGTRGFEEAIITRGGVNVKEVNPSTMESKKVNGLYFAGEVMDLDALTGGFNLQIAWSTGYLAGNNID